MLNILELLQIVTVLNTSPSNVCFVSYIYLLYSLLSPKISQRNSGKIKIKILRNSKESSFDGHM